VQATVELPEVEQLVSTVLLCLMSIMVEPLTLGEQPVKVTVPKLANGTREPPDEKSSTIHSALVSHSCADWPVKLCVTVLPLVLLMMVTEPALLLVALAVMVMLSPALMANPLKV
jgi:hypothetical protein